MIPVDPREIIFDQWSPITFKGHFGKKGSLGDGAGFKPPAWIGLEHQRRLQAYAILRSYMDNIAREFFVGSRNEIDERREYGDASLLVETIVAALLGEDQQIVTEGAEEMALEEPTSRVDAQGNELPPPTPDPEAEARRLAAEAALELQEFLRDWARDERLGLKLLETERLAVGLGDGVYSLGWSGAKKRPRLRVWDPTFYFPVLTDSNEDDYPRRVHIAWEVLDESLKGTQVKIRRITWELADIRPAQAEGTIGRLLGTGDQLHAGDRRNADGKIERIYPWNPDEPSTLTCYYTDATWTIDQASKSIDDLSESSAVYENDEDGNPIKQQDLFIDFVPVVHMPNTVALLNHFGRSLLSSVLQLLDDIASADTDLSAAAATTGHPVLALSGASVARDSKGKSTLTYRPGEILETGDGKMDVLDTSKSLVALMDLIEFMLKRLSVNSRVSETLQGRVSSGDVNSGIQLILGFGPTETLVRHMRLVRAEKYPILLRFVHRFFLAAADRGEIDVADVPPEWIHSEVSMGRFLPQDQTAAVDQVTKLLVAKTISLETAILMLIEAGFPIDDAREEVRRIQSRDFTAAETLLAATDDRALVYDYLGQEMPPEPTPPPVDIVPSGQPAPPVPPVPGQSQLPAQLSAPQPPAQ
jgi:hypothetical protein